MTLKVGITGQPGFIGTHLHNTLGLYPDRYTRINFEDAYFESKDKLETFVGECDVIVHLAAMNRHGDPQVIYDTNIRLVKTLTGAIERSGNKPHLVYSSSIQEDNDSLYGRSKKEGREFMADWAEKNGCLFTGLVFPNIFGPFGNPYYNSFIATFSHQLHHGETPVIEIDKMVPLLYVGEAVKILIRAISEEQAIRELRISPTSERKVTEILQCLRSYKTAYIDNGIIPSLNTPFEINLFNTFRSYIDIANHYPVKYRQHADDRGAFVEIMKSNQGGQLSFSTTKPGITRGNHFHTRKIERFAVIKGEAIIQLRRIGTDEVMAFHLSGEEPAYVDMPIWYTHNITNTGNDTLYTLFWINEFFNPDDPDTWFEKV